MTYYNLVVIAKTFGPLWMMGFFVIVIIRAYNPKRRAAYDRVAQSVLTEEPPEVQK